MRHAKADWPGGVADHERPLEERGHREAPLAGKWLLKHNIVPGLHPVLERAANPADMYLGVRRTRREGPDAET